MLCREKQAESLPEHTATGSSRLGWTANLRTLQKNSVTHQHCSTSVATSGTALFLFRPARSKYMHQLAATGLRASALNFPQQKA